MASTKNPIEAQWLSAAAGSTIVVPAGFYPRATLKKSSRPAFSAPVTIRGDGLVVFERDIAVGGADTLLLKSGLRELILENITLDADDRAGLKSEGPAGARKVSLIDCSILGNGVGPTDHAWENDCTWGQHHYFTGAWSEIRTRTERIYKEHADYRHQLAGNHAFFRCVTKHCGRTRFQVVNRMKEFGTPMPAGYGDILFVEDDVEDVCTGDGGSAYTLNGGMPDSTITLDRSKVRLGCNKALAAPFNKWITGALVMQSSPESKPGAGDAAHPGGTKALRLIEPDIEVGTVWPGEGNARRSNVKVSAVGEFLIGWGDGGRIVGGTNGIALEILRSTQSFKFSGTPAQFVGKVRYYGTTFSSWNAFVAAHPETRI